MPRKEKDYVRKKKKKGKGKKEKEEVNKYEEDISNWTKADYVADKDVEMTERFQKLMEKFERPPSPLEKPDFFEDYEFDENRIKTANKEGITRTAHMVIKSLEKALERRQVRGTRYGSDEPILLTRHSKMPDVIWQRVYAMLRLNEKLELTPMAIGWSGSMVNYRKSKKLLLNWKSQWGEMTEIEALIETLAAIIEEEDTTNNESGCQVKLGELVLHKILQVRNATLKAFIEPSGKVEDARNVDLPYS